MTNRYANLVGTAKIKDSFGQITAGFDVVQTDMDIKFNHYGGYQFGTTGLDMNTLKSQGFFQVTSSTLNIPISGNFGVVWVWRIDDTYVFQKFVSTNNGKTFERSCLNSVWQAWKEIPAILSGGYKVQSGAVLSATVVTAGTPVNVTVTFPTAFSATPGTVLAVETAVGTSSATYINVIVSSVSATSVTFAVNSGVAQVINFAWLAIGT